MLVISKDSLKVAVDDLKHDMFAYENLQKGLHSRASKGIIRFSRTFPEEAEKLISKEKSCFGRKLLQTALSLI